MTLYNYLEPDAQQLKFHEGEFIWVSSDGAHPEEDWWYGTKKSDESQEGYFAKAYVKVLPRKINSSTKQSAKIAELASALNLK